jgi:ATP-dependent helicase/nuclease subunit A
VEADRVARIAAQRSFDVPMVLEAGAGTGKTAVLVARVVAWCCGPGWEGVRQRLIEGGTEPAPEDVAARTVRGVVAITFTEAAAAEMATRVAQALLDLRHGQAPPGVDVACLPSPDETARRAGHLVGVLDQLGVRTIHAFCRRLLAGYAIDAGLRPGFEVDADGQAQAAAARDTLEAALPSAYGEPGDPDYEALADAKLGPADIEEALLALLAEGAQGHDLAGDPFEPARTRSFWLDLAEAAAGFVSLEAGRLVALKGSRKLAEMAGVVAESRPLLDAGPPDGAAETQARVAALRELWRKDVVAKLQEAARGKFGARGADALGDDAPALAVAARDLHGALCHALRIDIDVLEPARRVLGPLLAGARQSLRARGVQTFGGLLRDARDLVTEQPEVASRVRADIDQLLVDEFQDTDPLQCELLAAIALDGEPAERPGLFLVGDPKQSIYGWRSADLGAYHGFVDRLVEAGGKVHPLVVNFRSVPAILREVERLVSPVMEEERGWQPPYEGLVACDERSGTELDFGAGRASVEHWVTSGFDREEGARLPLGARDAVTLEARALARDLVALRERGVSLGDVAVLMRASSDFDVILGALREAGLPFVVEREEHHYRRREVMDAVALVRCILDPNDAVAMVASLRSSLVGVPDVALVPLWKIGLPARASALRGRSEEKLAELVADVRGLVPGLGAGQDVPGLERLAGWEEGLVAFLTALDGLRRRFEQDPPDRFVEALRLELPLEVTEASRHLGAHRLASLDRFHRDLVEALEAHGGSAAAVAGWLRRAGASDREHREGRPRTMGDDAVHVLTLHKAKGLGFGHVYWLQTHKGRGRSVGKRTALARRDGRTEYTLFDAPTPGLRAFERDRERVDALERVRLSYVAATRAKDRLVIAGVRRDVLRDVEVAASHADLLAHRLGAAPDLDEAIRQAADDGVTGTDGEDGVRWRFLGLEEDRVPSARPAEDTVAPRQFRDEDGQLALARAAAAAYQARPFAGTASGLEVFADSFARVEAGDPAPDPVGGEDAAVVDEDAAAARAVAMAAGTAVHAALEHDDPAASAEARRERASAAIDAALATGLASAARGAARERARALTERFFEGPLAERLAAIAPRIVARELPVLVAPDPEADGEAAAVGCLTGAIDLVYRDPADDAWVIVDYKTDDVAEGPALDARARGYLPQGAVYVRALQQALALPTPPRLELWFVAPGCIWSETPAAS